MAAYDTLFSKLPDDVVLNIFSNLEEDPRNWARLDCVSTKFSSLIRNVCLKNKCFESIPSVLADLLSDSDPSSPPPGGWPSLHKLSVCCPGLIHAGVLLETTDPNNEISKRRKICDMSTTSAHLASGVWDLSREQGNKLLHSRFRGDCLYVCDWPGCVHGEERRKYMLFRGIFKDFRRSRVWRTIKDDGDVHKRKMDCAFCSCKETWELHSSFCLRRGLECHVDGDPVVRAYVCQNGHVSGAWTDVSLWSES